MKLNAFWKGLIMAVIGFISTTLSDLESFNLAYVAITTLGFTIVYIAKNAIWPSISLFGQIDLQDIISGVIVAAGMAVSSFAASVITTGAVDWHALWIAVSGAVVGYIVKTFSQNKAA